MLSVEKTIIIQILCDFIQKRKTNIPDDINLNTLQIYGKRHEILGIIYYQTKLPKFLPAYSSTIYANVNREKMIQELCGQFSFDYFIVKGSSVAELYPVPTLRTMGDIDLVVHGCDREAIHEILIRQGYKNVSKIDDREWQYYKNKMEFELHDHLIYKEAVNNIKQESFFNDFWTYVHDNQLDWNFHFLFLVSHLRKHFMNEGVGLRQFMDIAIVATYTELEWSWIEQKAEEIEILPFLKVVLSFCNRWFELVTPMGLVELEADFYESATNKIIDDGVFGFANPDNEGTLAVNEYRKNGKTGMIMNALSVVFPSYRNLKYIPQYSFVNGKPYLVPVAWIYRAFRGRKKRKVVVDQIKESFATKEQIDKREAMYKQWGL